jgi:hypothetical protein
VLTQLETKSGYWRLDNISKQTYECPVKQACNTSANRNSSLDNKCAQGHEGILCMVCSDGFARSGSTSLCTKCDVTWVSVFASLGVGVLVLVGFVCLLKINRRFPSGALRPLLNAWQQLSVILQFDSDWPDSLKVLAAALKNINLDVPMAGPVCLGIPFNFYYRLWFAVLTIAVFVAVPWLRYLFRLRPPWLRNLFGMKRSKASLEQVRQLYFQTLSDTVIIVLIVHPPISGLAIQIFRCETFESPMRRVSMLVSDYSLACTDGAWSGMGFFAMVILVFFSFGVPVLFARLMWKRRHKLYFTKAEQRYLDFVRQQERERAGEGDTDSAATKHRSNSKRLSGFWNKIVKGVSFRRALRDEMSKPAEENEAVTRATSSHSGSSLRALQASGSSGEEKTVELPASDTSQRASEAATRATSTHSGSSLRALQASGSSGEGKAAGLSANDTSQLAPVIVDVDANADDGNDADQQAEIPDEIKVMLETLRGDGMSSETESALTAAMVRFHEACRPDETNENENGGVGGSKNSDSTTSRSRPSPQRLRDVERTKKLLGILYQTYRHEMYFFEANQMIFKVLLWISLVMFIKGKKVM